MSLELRNINGNIADIYTTDGVCVFKQWPFSSPPKLAPLKSTASLAKILKLREAGFEIDEIIKLLSAVKVD